MAAPVCRKPVGATPRSQCVRCGQALPKLRESRLSRDRAGVAQFVAVCVLDPPFWLAPMSRREWNRSADQFEELVCDIASEETNNQLRRFVSAAKPSPKKSVLVDLGCGTGTFVQKFGKHFRQIFAADFATAVVKKAEKTYKGATPATWRVADVKECPK